MGERMHIPDMRLPAIALAVALAGCAGAAMEGANMARDEAIYRNNLQAAQAGDAEAQLRVGQSLCCSLGDRQGFYDTRQAVEWLCRASAQGQARASHKLGQIYSGDVVDGVRLLRRVAERVSERPENLPVSYAWLQYAAAQGSSGAAEDAAALWDELDFEQREAARRLVAANVAPPCGWDEVIVAKS